MNEKWRPRIKTISVFLILLMFVATLPAVFQNANKSEQVEKETKQLLDTAKKVCDGGCDPTSWEIAPENQNEAKLYCITQCQNNMKGIRDSLLNEGFPILFTNQYNYRVAQIYCLLGLNCPQKKISDIINNY
jgi:hypothetical protein